MRRTYERECKGARERARDQERKRACDSAHGEREQSERICGRVGVREGARARECVCV